MSPEPKPTGVEGLLQVLKKQTTKEPREDTYRQEEAGTTRDPVRAVSTQAAAGDDAVHVGMVLELLPPRVQHGEEADLRAEMLRVSCNRPQRFGRGAKEDAVDDGFVDDTRSRRSPRAR